jgi:hypothetical protein
MEKEKKHKVSQTEEKPVRYFSQVGFVHRT